jgi:AAA+ superfamily predicted ATPase
MGIERLKTEVSLTIRARYPIIYLVSWEEARVLEAMKDVATSMSKLVYTWSCTDGFDNESFNLDEGQKVNPALDRVVTSPERAIFVFKDLHAFLDDHRVVRKLRDVANHLRRSYKTVIILSPVLKIPVELEKDITVIDVPLPDEAEMSVILRNFLDAVRVHPSIEMDIDDALFGRLVRSCLGLTASEAENVLAKALVFDKRFSVDDLPRIIDEKKQIIRKTGMLEYFELNESMENVGGLDELKKWLKNRSYAFSEKARAYGLPEPKGVLLLGVQGCGKSLAAKATAAEWKLPLLRLDVGSVFNSFIGSSEENMRKAIRIAESLAPAVLWLDEIEKGFSGGIGTGQVDAGVTARVFATFLTWLQEKKAPVFVFATANEIWALPPEFFRKGRFDEVFFVDLPQGAERDSIFRIHLAKRGRKAEKFDIPALAKASDGMSGAEIEEAVISAMYDVFPQNRDITSDDIQKAMKATVPLSVTMKESIDDLRAWATHRARNASGLPRQAAPSPPAETGKAE